MAGVPEYDVYDAHELVTQPERRHPELRAGRSRRLSSRRVGESWSVGHAAGDGVFGYAGCMVSAQPRQDHADPKK
jgi:hypothetical protein